MHDVTVGCVTSLSSCSLHCKSSSFDCGTASCVCGASFPVELELSDESESESEDERESTFFCDDVMSVTLGDLTVDESFGSLLTVAVSTFKVDGSALDPDAGGVTSRGRFVNDSEKLASSFSTLILSGDL